MCCSVSTSQSDRWWHAGGEAKNPGKYCGEVSGQALCSQSPEQRSLVFTFPLSHAHTSQMLHRRILHALIKFRLLTFRSSILIFHHLAAWIWLERVSAPVCCRGLENKKSRVWAFFLFFFFYVQHLLHKKGSSSQKPTCYHSPAPLPYFLCSCVRWLSAKLGGFPRNLHVQCVQGRWQVELRTDGNSCVADWSLCKLPLFDQSIYTQLHTAIFSVCSRYFS